MLDNYGVMEFCLVDSEVPPEYLLAPVRYGKEDGSDGVVRVSASNLNFNYLSIGPTRSAGSIDWDAASQYAKDATDKTPLQTPDPALSGQYYALQSMSQPGDNDRSLIPFAIPYSTCHSEMSGRRSIMSGSANRQYVLPLIKQAINVDLAGYNALADAFNDATKATYDTVRDPQHNVGFLQRVFGDLVHLVSQPAQTVTDMVENPKSEYNPHSQVVFRILDHLGQPVNDYSIFFNSYGGGQPGAIINDIFEDQHKNLYTPNTMNFYIKTFSWNDTSKDWIDEIPAVNGVTLEIDAVAPQTHRVLYLPVRLEIPSAALVDWIQPHRTTIVDVELIRLPMGVTCIVR
jgi:hypothetical protein